MVYVGNYNSQYLLAYSGDVKMSLSDKIFKNPDLYWESHPDDEHVLQLDDVKEFIKKLKELAKSDSWKGNCYECGSGFLEDNFLNDLDRLAGEKLI